MSSNITRSATSRARPGSASSRTGWPNSSPRYAPRVPGAYIVANSDPYLPVNVTADARGLAAAASYRASIDAHLLENLDAAALDYAQGSLAGETRLILESDGSPAYNFADSWARGILYTAPNQSYNSLGTFAYPATAGADTLRGGDGPNQIDGLGGNDVLIGGRGPDALTGGSGTDPLDGGADADQHAGGTGDDPYHRRPCRRCGHRGGGAGAATVFCAVTIMRSRAGVHVETLSTTVTLGTAAINLTGNELRNTIYGNAGANTLDGNGGADALAGFGGDDFFIVDNASRPRVEAAGGGTDRVLRRGSYTLGRAPRSRRCRPSNLGTDAINLTGNEFANTIFGNAGANVLDGGGGADVLAGFGGADSFAFNTALAAAMSTRSPTSSSATTRSRSTMRCSPASRPGALNANAS